MTHFRPKIHGLLLCIACFWMSCGPFRLEEYEIHGIDVSRYQGKIHWQQVGTDDTHFVFIKASEGIDHADPKFVENWAGAKEANILRGAYHFFHPNIDGRQQARHFLAQVQLESGDLPPVLDVEVTDGETPWAVRKRVKEWLDEVKKQTGVSAIVYTNVYFYRDILKGDIGDHVLWIAAYNPERADVNQKVIPWSFWQYSDEGYVEGIEGPVDWDVFCGNLDELKALCLK